MPDTETELEPERTYIGIPVPYCPQCAKPWIMRVGWRLGGQPSREWTFQRDCACWDTSVKPRRRPEPILKFKPEDKRHTDPDRAALHVLDLTPLTFEEPNDGGD